MSDDPIRRDPSIGVLRFSARQTGGVADDILRRELTDTLRRKVEKWIESLARNNYFSALKSRAYHRLDLDPSSIMALTESELLDVLDQVISLAHLAVDGIRDDHYGHQIAEKFLLERLSTLDEILADARSIYVVGSRVEAEKNLVCLATRVDLAVAEAVSQTAQSAGTYGAHLRLAWSALHRHAPDAEMAYKQAVKAIESVLGPLVLPDSVGPTLGQIKAGLRDGGWKFALRRTGPAGRPTSVPGAAENSTLFLLDLIERVYGSESRHADGDGLPREQSLEEAAAAVYAAIAIIGWAESGTLTK